ncbi:MAG: hypothetical protein ABMA15_20285, partial [Vicinamibacterales bacterium]
TALDTGDESAADAAIQDAVAHKATPADIQALRASLEILRTTAAARVRIREAVEDARRRFLSGDHDAAIALLENADVASDAVVQATAAEFRRARGEIAQRRRQDSERLSRDRRLALLLAAARSHLRERGFDAALAALEEARQIDATHADVLSLTERIRQAKESAEETARVEESLRAALHDFESALSAKDLQTAAARLDEASALKPHSNRVASAGQRLREAQAELVANQTSAERRRQIEDKIALAEEHMSAGNFAAAEGALSVAGTLDQNDPRIPALAAQVREAVRHRAEVEAEERRGSEETARDGLLRAQEHLRTGDHAAAHEEVDAVLRQVPGLASAVQLKATIEKAHRAAERDNEKRRLATERHMSRARGFFERGKFSKAIAELDSMLQHHLSNAESIALLERCRQAEDSRGRAEHLETLVRRAASSPPERALLLLREALDIAPTDQRVIGLIEECEGRLLNAHEGGQVAADNQKDRSSASLGERVAQFAAASLDRARTQMALVAARPDVRRAALPACAALATLLVAGGLLWMRAPAPAPGTDPARASAPVPPPTPSVDKAPADSVAPAPPQPPTPTPGTFALRVTGDYPFELLYRNTTRPADTAHRITLPSGSQTVRVRNSEYFLDISMSVDGRTDQALARTVPGLNTMTIWSSNETCEIAIDGRRVGYHPVTQKVVIGSHLVSVHCPDGSTRSKRVVMGAGPSEPVKF